MVKGKIQRGRSGKSWTDDIEKEPVRQLLLVFEELELPPRPQGCELRRRPEERVVILTHLHKLLSDDWLISATMHSYKTDHDSVALKSSHI